MTENKHSDYDLKQMQSLPLEVKIQMTKERIKKWYDSWFRFEIENINTGKIRYVTATKEPPLKKNEHIISAGGGTVMLVFQVEKILQF